MRYINHKTQTVYSGDKAHWLDIETTSEQPSPHHKPVVKNGKHTGWELNEQSLENEMYENRRQAYRAESDPIYFQWQRGEATEQEWLDAVQAIKTRYPKP